MPVVSSEIVQDVAQADGRRSVIERHTLADGTTRDFSYLADADLDANAVMAARVPELNSSLTQTEIESNIASVLANGAAAVTTFLEGTQQQSIRAMAERFASLGPYQVVLLAEFLAAQSDEGLTTIFALDPVSIAMLRGGVAQLVGGIEALRGMVAPIAARALNNG